MITVTSFKTAFPEFASNSDAQVEFWLEQAVNSINASLYGNQYEMAVLLFAAHFISGAMLNQRAGAVGAVPGSQIGPTISKTVGPISKTMGTMGIDARGGQFNTTTYGQRLFALMKAVVAGGMYRVPNRRGSRIPYHSFGSGWVR